MILNVLIPTNSPPTFNDAFLNQCKNILKSLSKKINLHITWVMFPSLPPYNKLDCISTNDSVIFSDDFEDITKIFEYVKPDVVFINGSLDFHNLENILVAKFKKIPTITLFFRNPYFKKESVIFTIKSRLRSIFMKDNIDVNMSHHNKSTALRFFFYRLLSLSKTLNYIKFPKILSFFFLLQYIKMSFSDMSPVHKFISGDINLCNVEKNKNILINSDFKNSSIFVVGDPYFDNHEIHKSKNLIKKNILKPKILFVPTPTHEHSLCSSKDEYNLIINVVNTILKHDFDVALKIHPSSSLMNEYVNALKGNTLQPIKIFQSEDLVELLKNYDIMLTYGGTSAIYDAILLAKPIVNLDFNNDVTGQAIFRDNKLITHCTDISSLILDFEYAYKKTINSSDIEFFFQKYLGYSKNKPSELAANILYVYLKKTFKLKRSDE